MGKWAELEILGCPDDIRDRLYMLAGLARRESEEGRTFTVSAASLKSNKAFNEQIVPIVPSTIEGKSNSILEYLGSKSRHPGDGHDPHFSTHL
jgi:hypothetical protein